MPRAHASVFLIGFMGSGKSSAGRILSRRLGLPFTDTDRAIEKRTGRAVRAIFKTCGELAFRKLETAEIRRAARSGGVIAVGGGAAAQVENVRTMRAAGTVVYLRASYAVLAKRVSAGGAAARPLWPKAKALLRQRRPLYAKAAHLSVNAALGSPEELAARIAGKLA